MFYYNENDLKAAAWLRELIALGHIPAGDVDERDVRDVTPNDLKRYAQHHFFAGIGGWPLALRRAGWPDDRPVWTGSCPCQPFSAAGQGKGFDDERHLWPDWFWLIAQCEPSTVFGEQVASKDGLAWLDLVQTDMEGAGNAFGAVDMCAAGVGAPHIRQRLWWVAERLADPDSGKRERVSDGERRQPDREEAGRIESDGEPTTSSELLRVEHPQHQHQRPARRITPGTRNTARPSEAVGLADNSPSGRREERQDVGGEFIGNRPEGVTARFSASCSDHRAGPTNGLWRDADWLFCRDGKWRPVEPGTFPLAHGLPARVGRLRGYGNAINVEVAQTFVAAYLQPVEPRSTKS